MKSEKRDEGQMKKIFAIFTLLVLMHAILLLSACDMLGNKQPTEVNYHKGIEGVEINFLDQAPPDELYENSTFNINIEIENRGAYDVTEDKAGILTMSFDPFYIGATQLRSNERVEVNSNSLIVRGIQLYGKSKYHPVGTLGFFSFPNFNTQAIMGQREQPSTKILASICYPYVTEFSGLVCVDMSAVGENVRTQSCYQKDLTMSDQGAPIAIYQIEVENQPAGADVVRPVFTVHIANKDSGTVLSPAYDASNFDRVCSFQTLNREDFNTVDVKAMLSDGRYLECIPNPVRLFEGTGFTRCQVSEDDLIIGHQNYEAVLSVNISYVYLTSISKEVDIKRINVFGGTSQPAIGCLAFEVQYGGGCVSKCKFCSDTSGGGECQPSSADPNPQHIRFEDKGFDCKCSSDEASKLYPDGWGVPFAGYCPGASYCCRQKCTASEVMIDGTCYSKCSKCGILLKKCACGNGDDASAYKLLGEGSFCCPLTVQDFAAQVDCKAACTTTTETSSTIK